MIACFLPTLSRSCSKMWSHSLIIQKYKVTYRDLCSTSKLLHQWNGFVDNNKGSKSTSAVCKAILWQCLSLKVLDRSSSTEKQSPYHHEIMSLNSDDAIDIISWERSEVKKKKKSVLSGWDGQHTFSAPSIIMTLASHQHLQVTCMWKGVENTILEMCYSA